ncbi:MAG: hypothetical protein WBV94_05775 [Blastocatellia bacterium]
MKSKAVAKRDLNKKPANHPFTIRTGLLIAAMIASCAALVAAAAYSFTNTSKPKEMRARPVQEIAPSGNADYVRLSRLRPQLREALIALGDRLEKPGKERLVLTGTLSRSSGTKSPFRLFLEYPGRLRFEEQNASQVRVEVFNGLNELTTGGAVSQQDEDLIETLVYDSVDNYFIGQMKARATRFLGTRFRLDDGEDAGYKGPFYDIYQVADQVQSGASARAQDKLYYFNSDSQLMERVRYQTESKTNVEIQFSDWTKVESQTLPSRILRLENEQVVLSFDFTSVLVMPRAQDGIFDRP